MFNPSLHLKPRTVRTAIVPVHNGGAVDECRRSSRQSHVQNGSDPKLYLPERFLRILFRGVFAICDANANVWDCLLALLYITTCRGL